MYRGSGSIGVVGAARTGMLVARDPEDPETCVIASTKSNLGPAAPALAYRIEDHDGIGRIVWRGVVDRQASDLLASDDRGDSEERDAVASFLVEYLTQQGGVAAAKDCAKAIAAGFGPKSDMQLVRIRKRAGVRTRKGNSMTAPWLWELEHGESG